MFYTLVKPAQQEFNKVMAWERQVSQMRPAVVLHEPSTPEGKIIPFPTPQDNPIFVPPPKPYTFYPEAASDRYWEQVSEIYFSANASELSEGETIFDVGMRHSDTIRWGRNGIHPDLMNESIREHDRLVAARYEAMRGQPSDIYDYLAERIPDLDIHLPHHETEIAVSVRQPAPTASAADE